MTKKEIAKAFVVKTIEEQSEIWELKIVSEDDWHLIVQESDSSCFKCTPLIKVIEDVGLHAYLTICDGGIQCIIF